MASTTHTATTATIVTIFWRVRLVPRADADGAGSPRILGAQVDPQDEEAVLDLTRRVPEHGEVLIVELHALDEALPVGALERWHGSVAHGLRPLAEPPDHGIDIEGVAHGPTVPSANGDEAPGYRRPRR